MWLLFFLFVACSLTWGWAGRLPRFSGTKLRLRVLYGAFFSTGFSVLLIASAVPRQGLEQALLMGLILSVPSVWLSKRWLERRIQGSAIYYKRSYILRSRMGAVIGGIVGVAAAEYWRDRPWLGLSIVVMVVPWWASAIYQFFYVLGLESRLGVPIMERQR